MTKTKRISVKSAAGKYAVVCGAGVLARLAREIAKVGKFSSVQVVTSRKVWAAVGKKVLRGLGGAGAVRVHTFDDAETGEEFTERGIDCAESGEGWSGPSRGGDCGWRRSCGRRCGICGGELFARSGAGAGADNAGGADG